MAVELARILVSCIGEKDVQRFFQRQDGDAVDISAVEQPDPKRNELLICPIRGQVSVYKLVRLSQIFSRTGDCNLLRAIAAQIVKLIFLDDGGGVALSVFEYRVERGGLRVLPPVASLEQRLVLDLVGAAIIQICLITEG